MLILWKLFCLLPLPLLLPRRNGSWWGCFDPERFFLFLECQKGQRLELSYLWFLVKGLRGSGALAHAFQWGKSFDSRYFCTARKVRALPLSFMCLSHGNTPGLILWWNSGGVLAQQQNLYVSTSSSIIIAIAIATRLGTYSAHSATASEGDFNASWIHAWLIIVQTRMRQVHPNDQSD